MTQADGNNLPLVLVTGASGFVALHCVKRLLEGPYRVRGTVRSTQNTKKIAPLLRLPNAAAKLELVEADLLKSNNWQEVVSGCAYVMHVASPWVINATSEIVETAVQGTLTVLKAASLCPEVRKVVLTSSCAAVNDGHKNGNTVFDETFWTDPQSKRVEWYAVSKTLAEQAAWDFWKALPASSRFAFTVLNPTLVFGPVLSDVPHGSATILARMMRRVTNLAHPKVSLGLVDVRDVAEAHYRSLTTPATNGERILITATPSVWFSDIARSLRTEFSRYGYGITTWEVANFLIRFYAATGIDPEVKMMTHRMGPELKFSNAKSVRLLRMEYRPVDRAIVEMMHSMIDAGMVRSTKKYEDARKKGFIAIPAS